MFANLHALNLSLVSSGFLSLHDFQLAVAFSGFASLYSEFFRFLHGLQEDLNPSLDFFRE
jgi:hypothetical protein